MSILKKPLTALALIACLTVSTDASHAKKKAKPKPPPGPAACHQAMEQIMDGLEMDVFGMGHGMATGMGHHGGGHMAACPRGHGCGYMETNPKDIAWCPQKGASCVQMSLQRDGMVRSWCGDWLEQKKTCKTGKEKGCKALNFTEARILRHMIFRLERHLRVMSSKDPAYPHAKARLKALKDRYENLEKLGKS